MNAAVIRDAMNAVVKAVAIVALLQACSTAPGTVGLPGDGGGSASEVTSVSIGLPDRTVLKDQVADIESKMNTYQLIVTPVDAACLNATEVNQIDAYSASPTLTAALVQGCDYDVTLALGNRGGAPATTVVPPPPTAASPAFPTKPSYEGNIKGLIEKNCTGCHKVTPQAPDLSTYALASAFAAWGKGGFLELDAPPPAVTADATPASVTPPTTVAAAATTPATVADPTKLQATYYKNAQALRIKKEDIAGQAAIRVKLPLQLQPDGAAIGLGAK